jgi:hypothetical protein
MTEFPLEPPVQLDLVESPVCTLAQAIPVVGAHAIQTGNTFSARVARMLRDVGTSEEAAQAEAVFRIWVDTERATR